ncbi:O-antigen ligase family protein [Oxalobacteraceae sp. CFBP 8761]|nr:O-antigen ligase family protein [Oxalobacteraceae sp. CFBP 8761]
MGARIKNPFQAPVWLMAAIVILCLLIGAAIPVFTDAVGDHPGRLVALPAVLLLGVLLVYDYKKLLILILLFRSVGDRVLESTQVGIGDTRMGIGGLINLVVILITCMLVMEKPKEFPTKLARFWFPVLVMMAVGVVISYEKANAVKQYLGILSNFAMFIIAVYMVRSIDDFNKAIRLVLWSSAIPTLYAFVDIALNVGTSNFRLESTFTHPNILAFYVALMLVLCLYMLKSPLFNITPTGRVVVCCYLPLLLIQLLLTQTRSAWLSCLLIFVLYALLFERKYLLYLLVLPLVVVFVPSIQDRLMDLNQGNEVVRYAPLNSFAWRQLLWKAAIGWMEPMRLIYGYGLDGFGHFAGTFFPMDRTVRWDAHNVYVQFLFETGVIGLACYLWLYARVLWTLRSFARMDRVSGFLLLAVVVQYLIVSYSDNMFRYLVFNWYFWFTVGAACSLVHLYSLDRNSGSVNEGRA